MATRLTDTERAYLTQVNQAALVNPFSAARATLDAELAATSGDDPDQLARAISRLAVRLEAIDRRLEDSDFAEESDRTLYEYGVLFEAFHKFSAEFDAHIRAQISAGATVVPLTFGRSLLAWLVARSIPPARAERFLSLFFQMHRAWYFIAEGLTGVSRPVQALRESLWNNIFTGDLGRYERLLWDRMEDFSTILLGETGTGKGAAAAAIGRSGYIPWDATRERFTESFAEAFVTLNLSQYPESLIESELFGHRKGAFTGAVDHHDGVFARCSPHGAIFLDEIGEVSIPIQIKLLRVLQERSFTPVGSHAASRFSGRVIAATHRPLDKLRAEGRFRDDFYYRLCADVIAVPALRDRIADGPADLEALVATLVRRTLGQPSPEVAADVLAAIARDLGPAHPWPGNVRELEQCIRRVLLTGRCRDLPAPVAEAPDAAAQALAQGGLTAVELLDRYCAALYETHGTYEQVARVTGLDRRTVKKHVLAAAASLAEGEDPGYHPTP
ncbi:MAG: sigma-54-dependent Fis family transcriptional regulator [Myxococcales bacterium]|nr:sigma-54-dependent Fis family transcriptional regulator [Myxococcales bacterium]